jgi:hypothetical protein
MGREICRALWCLLAWLVSVGASFADPATLPRVRPADDIAVLVLAEGLSRSETFQRLVASVAESEVIVYVAGVERLSSDLLGTLRYMGTGAGGGRFLRVELNVEAFGGLDTPSALVAAVATLAHELHHALEVAGAGHVSDADAFERFYREIAEQRRPSVFDTRAARSTGEQVHFELTGRRR